MVMYNGLCPEDTSCGGVALVYLSPLDGLNALGFGASARPGLGSLTLDDGNLGHGRLSRLAGVGLGGLGCLTRGRSCWDVVPRGGDVRGLQHPGSLPGAVGAQAAAEVDDERDEGPHVVDPPVDGCPEAAAEPRTGQCHADENTGRQGARGDEAGLAERPDPIQGGLGTGVSTLR